MWHHSVLLTNAIALLICHLTIPATRFHIPFFDSKTTSKWNRVLFSRTSHRATQFNGGISHRNRFQNLYYLAIPGEYEHAWVATDFTSGSESAVRGSSHTVCKQHRFNYPTHLLVVTASETVRPCTTCRVTEFKCTHPSRRWTYWSGYHAELPEKGINAIPDIHTSSLFFSRRPSPEYNIQCSMFNHLTLLSALIRI